MRGEKGGLPKRSRALQVGLTPLHIAAAMGHAVVVDKLVASGAEKEAKDKVRARGR